MLNKQQSRIVNATQGIAKLQTQLQWTILLLKPILWNAEIIFNASKVSSVDKAFSVKIPEYSKHRAVQFGDPFYTHYSGYKMCLALYNSTSDNHLSFYLYLMKISYDDQLRWSLKGH